MPAEYKFCPYCAAPLTRGRPEGDLCERLLCSACDFVSYQSPRILVTCLATLGSQLVWMKRGTAPQKGLWAMPGGFMEMGEKPEQAAVRELFEETQITLDVNKLELFAIGSVPAMNQVYLVYRGEMTSRHMGTSIEASEVGLFNEDEAPWSEQAYPDLEEVVRHFYHDHQCSDYGVYCCVYENGVHRYRDTVRNIK